MRLSEYARRLGVSYQTARRLFKRGEILGAYQLPTGTIVVPAEAWEAYRCLPETMERDQVVDIVRRFVKGRTGKEIDEARVSVFLDELVRGDT